jgi:hypothetical protein
MKQSRRLPNGWSPEKGSPRRNKAPAAREHEPVTIERLERALALCAYLVTRDGPVVVPIFERIERELAVMRQEQDTVSRAKRLLENLGSPMQRNLLLTS